MGEQRSSTSTFDQRSHGPTAEQAPWPGLKSRPDLLVDAAAHTAVAVASHLDAYAPFLLAVDTRWTTEAATGPKPKSTPSFAELTLTSLPASQSPGAKHTSAVDTCSPDMEGVTTMQKDSVGCSDSRMLYPTDADTASSNVAAPRVSHATRGQTA